MAEAQLPTRIREARKDAGLSREQLAAHLGVSLATVVRMETGRTQRISVESLLKIGEATGKPLAWFLNGAAA